MIHPDILLTPITAFGNGISLMNRADGHKEALAGLGGITVALDLGFERHLWTRTVLADLQAADVGLWHMHHAPEDTQAVLGVHAQQGALVFILLVGGLLVDADGGTAVGRHADVDSAMHGVGTVGIDRQAYQPAALLADLDGVVAGDVVVDITHRQLGVGTLQP